MKPEKELLMFISLMMQENLQGFIGDSIITPEILEQMQEEMKMEGLHIKFILDDSNDKLEEWHERFLSNN